MSHSSQQEPLWFDLDSYFTRVESALEIDMDALAPARARPEGIANAWRLMRLAAQGLHPKRMPVSVLSLGDGKYRIIDGNSTYAVARASRWPGILALCFTSENIGR